MNRQKIAAAVALVALLAGVAGPLRAQPNAWEGKFVTTGDGTVHAVAGGQRHRLLTLRVTPDELAAIPEGAAAASVDQLGGAAAGPAAPAPATPAAPLVGRTTRICDGEAVFDLTVLRADWVKQLPEPAGGKAAGMWVFVVGELHNQGKGSRPLGNGESKLKIRDERGRVWGAVLPGNYSSLSNQTGADPLYSAQPAPGTAARVIAAFDVAADSQGLELFATTGC